MDSSNASKAPHILYLVRHGESIGNVERQFLAPENDILTQRGKEQVTLLATHLKEENISRIYSSDYERAVETAIAILNNASCVDNVNVYLKKELREKNLGVLEGKAYKEAIEAVLQSGKKLLMYEPPEGETSAQLTKRVASFCETLLLNLDDSKRERETVVVVSHTFVLMKLLEVLQENEKYQVSGWEAHKDFKLIRNATYMKIEAQRLDPINSTNSPREIKFLKTHCKDHLSEIQATDPILHYAQSKEEAKGFMECVQA